MNRFTFSVIMLSLLATSLFDNPGFCQRATYLPVHKSGENQVLKGDTAVFLLDGYKTGQIQWQQAEDGESWVDIPGQTADSLIIVPNQSTWYRAVILDGTCDPCYSENFGLTVVEKAEVITNQVTNITETSAQGGGNVLNDGGAFVTSRGIVISTTSNPTLSNYVIPSGNGTGSFSVNIPGLTPNTKYYVRAFATNDAGTIYGNQVEFTTHEAPQVVDVVNPATGKTWMDRNLGASRAATSSTDTEAYGDLYQWGRAADGHQKRTSGTTSTLSSSDTPGHGDFILAPNNPRDWRSPQNDNLWQGVNGVNNPCPPGYRLPTDAELNAERASWNSDNSDGAFASPLKLPVAGSRSSSNGSLYLVGSHSHYWSSSVVGAYSRSLHFSSSTADRGSDYRASGNSVRCIKD